MSVNSVLPPYPIFTDVDGSPLENGYVYVGNSGLNAEASPKTAYWDAALTVVATQPIRTLGGYPSRSGTPAALYVDGEYSILVKDKNSALVHSSLTQTREFGSDIIGYNLGAIGSVNRTVEDRLKERISVKDFGAVGDGVTDDWAAINAAVDHLITLGGGTMYFPQGSYYVSQTINVFKAPGYVTGFNLVGESRDETSIITDQDIVLIEHAENFRLRDISLSQTGAAKTGIGTATNAAKQTAYGEWRNVNISNFGYGIWWSYSLWNSVRDVRINNCGVGIRLSRNHNKTQATSNDAATGAWNVGWFQNVNTFDNVLINGGEVGIWGSPTGLVLNNVTCQGQSGDGSSNTVAPVGVKGTGLWLQNNGSNTSAFGVLGNVANGYYTEYTQQPIVSEYVPLIVNGGYFQGNTNVAPYPQVVKTIGATIELNNCSGADWFEYQVYADAGTVIGNTGGAVNTGTQLILNNGLYYINGFPRGGVEYFPISVTGASTTTVASFEGFGEPVRIDVAGIYDGFSARSASFLAIRTPGSVTRVQAEAGNSADITCTISGSAIQINTTGGLSYGLYVTITKMRQMTGSQVY